MGQICVRDPPRELTDSHRNNQQLQRQKQQLLSKPRCVQSTTNIPAANRSRTASSSIIKNEFISIDRFDSITNEDKYFFSLSFLHQFNSKLAQLSSDESLLVKDPVANLTKMRQQLIFYVNHLNTVVDKYRLLLLGDENFEESEIGYKESEAPTLTVDDSFRLWTPTTVARTPSASNSTGLKLRTSSNNKQSSSPIIARIDRSAIGGEESSSQSLVRKICDESFYAEGEQNNQKQSPPVHNNHDNSNNLSSITLFSQHAGQSVDMKPKSLLNNHEYSSFDFMETKSSNSLQQLQLECFEDTSALRISERLTAQVVVIEFHKLLCDCLPTYKTIKSMKFAVEFISDSKSGENLLKAEQQQEIFTTEVEGELATGMKKALGQVFEFVSGLEDLSQQESRDPQQFRVSIYFTETATLDQKNYESQKKNYPSNHEVKASERSIKLSSHPMDLSMFKDQKIHYLNLQFSNGKASSSSSPSLSQSMVDVDSNRINLNLQIRCQFVYDQGKLVLGLLSELKENLVTLDRLISVQSSLKSV